MTQLSQFNEQEIIRDYFGGFVGKFVDVGCSGGISLSNTFALGLANWHGLLVEASPTHFANLIANYVNRGGFKFVNAALWHSHGVMEFNYHPGFYSSLIYKDEPGLFSAQYFVSTVTADDLKAIQPECDMLNLDIEAADTLVFPSLMTAYPNCRLVVVEHANKNEVRSEWSRLFDAHGLHAIGQTPENYVAVKK